MRVPWHALVVAFFAVGSAFGPQEVVTRARIVKRWVRDAEPLLEYCTRRGLFAERLRLAETILRFEPGHARARRLAGWTKQRGVWRPPKQRPRVKNRAGADTSELERREATARLRARDALIELWRRASPQSRAELTGDLLALAPDDAVVRSLLGEQRVDGRWVLDETARARTRRQSIVRAVSRALAAPISVTHDEILPPEAETEVEWKTVRRSGRIRIVSTGGVEEVEKTARAVAATAALFREVFETKTRLRPRLAIWLVTNADDRGRLLAAHPDAPSDRAFASARASTWFADSLANWGESETLRRDVTVRQITATLLMDEFGLEPRVGWAWEGIGLAFTRWIAKTRLSVYVERGEYGAGDDGVATALPKSDDDWLARARRVVPRRGVAGLVTLSGKAVNDLDAEDLISAYALALYLIEGRPEATPRFLEVLGRGRGSFVDAVRAVLGLELDELQERLVRWLREMPVEKPASR